MRRASRRRVGLPLGLAGVFLLVAFAIGCPPADAATARGAAHGLATGVAGVDDDDPLPFRRIARGGASFVHITIPWGAVAPAQAPAGWEPTDPADPNYDWSQTDRYVAYAVRSRLVPVLKVHGSPTWVQRCAPPLRTDPTCDPDPQALAAFATAAARRYSGHFSGLPRVRYWQGLTEPNLSIFFKPQFENGRPASARLYRDLIDAFYFAVKRVSRSNLVIGGGLGPIENLPWTIGPMQFTRELLCMRGRRRPRPSGGNCGGGVHFDIFDIHPYTTGGPTHRGRADDVQLGDLAKLQRLLAAADRAGRIRGRFRRTPLWVAEFSWDSNPPDPGGLPTAINVRWTAEALFRAWRAGVTHFFWYPLRDELTKGLPPSQTIQGGLFLRGGTLAADRPKRLLAAFRFPFVAFSRRDGFHFWGRTPSSRRGRVVIQIRRGGAWRRATVARADANGIFQGVVRGSYGRNRRGFARAVYRGERAIPFSLKPVRDFYQPPFG